MNPNVAKLIFTWCSLIVLYKIKESASQPNFIDATCPNTTLFISNSQYETNLNTLFSILSSNATYNPTGFLTASTSTLTSDPVYGLYLCRGDQNSTACSDCVKTATTTGLPKMHCPSSIIATIWYDECMVRYSNESFFGVMTRLPATGHFYGRNVSSDDTPFIDALGNMMQDIVAEAATGVKNPKKYYSSKVVSIGNNKKLYGLGQCTQDLTMSDCNLCLIAAVGRIEYIYDEAVTILLTSCYIRYATHLFFNDALDLSSLPATHSNSKIKSINAAKIIAIVVPLAALSLALIICVVIYLLNKKAASNCSVAIANGDSFVDVDSLHFDLRTLQFATNNFSVKNKLGQGGFGAVYKGTLRNGKEIAVKRLASNSKVGAIEFKNEVLCAAKLQHKNLVQLIGFCLQGDEKLLVFEYIPKRSLDYFLFDPARRVELDWRKRYKIIIGVARGMLYLHQDSQLRIIHRDLKAGNILLDGDMNPKISDFGMARIFGADQTQENTRRVVGTYGYMSPEYAMHGQFSIRSDVYSFGVLVLEIICGRRNNSFYQSSFAMDLLSYVWKNWIDGMLMEIIDPDLRDSCPIQEVARSIQLGLLCVQQSAMKRPTMATVVRKLDSPSSTLPMPEQPGFFTKSRLDRDDLSNHSTSSYNRSPCSINKMSITDFEPR